MDELNAILGPAANEWLAAPSGPAYDALAAAAASIVATGRPLGRPLMDPFTGSAHSASDVLRLLSTYPGSDEQVIFYLDALNLPSVASPFVLKVGTFRVNEEMPPGVYQATDVGTCYWATLDDAGEINDNNFINSARQVRMTVRSSDFAVENDCEPMIKID